jgi:AcrR family transcriptional regulator
MAKKAHSKPEDVPQRIRQAALNLAAERGWAGLALADIAAAAELSLADLYEVHPSKAAILEAFSRDIDRQVLAARDEASGESARDRLFDVLMKRFDALAPHRDGLAAIARDAARDPLTMLCWARSLRHSMGSMLEAAGIVSSGISGELRIKGLGAIYLATLRDWFRDDTADKSRTMAALDGRLRRAERCAGWLERRRPSSPAAAA